MIKLILIIYSFIILVQAIPNPDTSKFCLNYFKEHLPKDYTKKDCYSLKNEHDCPLIWNYEVSACRRKGYCRYKNKNACLVSIRLGSNCVYKTTNSGSYCINKNHTLSPTLSPTPEPTKSPVNGTSYEYEYAYEYVNN